MSKRRKNLKRLAKYLESLPACYPNFDMGSYNEDSLIDSECQTVACAIGHGPYIGISVLDCYYDGTRDIDWARYCQKNFAESRPGEPTVEWLFSYHWAAVDNTPQGAASRIRYFLKHGVPWGFSLGELSRASFLNWYSRVIL